MRRRSRPTLCTRPARLPPRPAFVLLGLLLAPGCGEPAPEASGDAGPGARIRAAAPTEEDGSVSGAPPSSEAAPGEARNRIMGTGEPLEPQPFTLEQRFLQAVREGDRTTIERALELGASPRAKDDLGRSALLLAVRDAGSLDLVRALHGRGARVDEADRGGRTPLSFAAERGRREIVRYLLERGAAVDRADQQGRTPFFHAVAAGHDEIARALLEAGADVDARDQFGDTPLILACAKGHAGMAELLQAHGADPTLTDQEGRTARERAAPGTTPCLEEAPEPGAPPPA